jgi:uncharacterized membrane protein YccC
VSLALLLAFWLQMDNPFWAGTSAGIVCQPSLGASLRKANFRLVGTVIGAVLVVLLMAAFPQSRAGFLLALAIWCGLCGFGATVLTNFASYGAALAGYTAVIVAADAVGHPNHAFMLAIARASEICLGIVCAGVVLLLSGRGRARERAATAIATIARETGLGLRASILGAGGQRVDSSPARRALIARASALSELLDETVGESPDLRVRSRTLQAAVDGLFVALSGWRMVATHLETVTPAQATEDAAPVVAALPAGPAIVMTARDRPAETRDRCRAAGTTLVALPVETPAQELVAAGTAEALFGLERALNGVAMLVEPERARDAPGSTALRTPDLLPALLNGLRAFLIVLLIALIWIVTAWPDGPSALTFGAIVVLLLSPRGDSAISNTLGFLAGTLATAGLAALVDFAVLPNREGFVQLALIMAVVLVPLGAISAGSWHKPFFTAAVTNFTPLLQPANLPAYDTVAFYNTTLAIGVGVGIGVLVMALLPQLSPERRAERLRLLTLRDLRRLATLRRPPAQGAWEGLMYGRIAALPEGSSALAHAQLVAALFVGEAVLRLRNWMARAGGASVPGLLPALAEGRMDDALRALDKADAAFAASAGPHGQAMRARAGLIALREALVRHAAYFAEEGVLF